MKPLTELRDAHRIRGLLTELSGERP